MAEVITTVTTKMQVTSAEEVCRRFPVHAGSRLEGLVGGDTREARRVLGVDKLRGCLQSGVGFPGWRDGWRPTWTLTRAHRALPRCGLASRQPDAPDLGTWPAGSASRALTRHRGFRRTLAPRPQGFPGNPLVSRGRMKEGRGAVGSFEFIPARCVHRDNVLRPCKQSWEQKRRRYQRHAFTGRRRSHVVPTWFLR